MNLAGLSEPAQLLVNSVVAGALIVAIVLSIIDNNRWKY
jgi:hypothetical protein